MEFSSLVHKGTVRGRTKTKWHTAQKQTFER